MNGRSLLAVTAVACILTASHWAMAQQGTVVQGDTLKWGAGPPTVPAGAQAAGVVGDATKEGGYVVRLKLPAGYKVAPHVHPNDENVTVLSGTFHIGFGDKFDESKGQALKAGGYALAPKGVQHFAWASEETVIQLHGVGPGGITYVNPADDPRKK
jgi:quercetin dioxygenase-like cupin family protein